MFKFAFTKGRCLLENRRAQDPFSFQLAVGAGLFDAGPGGDGNDD